MIWRFRWVEGEWDVERFSLDMQLVVKEGARVVKKVL